MAGLWQELRYALRQLPKSPGFTAVAVVTLALGIGANSAIFSAVNAILLRPLPYSHSRRLIALSSPEVAAPATLVALREQIKQAEYAGYTQDTEVNMTGQNEPARLVASEVSANFFRVLGVRPLLGRDFRDGDDLAGHGHGVLLSYGSGIAVSTVYRTLSDVLCLSMTRRERSIGLPAALVSTRVIRSRLFQVKNTDPATYLLGTLLILCIALLASYIPARRAAKVDPMVALR